MMDDAINPTAVAEDRRLGYPSHHDWGWVDLGRDYSAWLDAAYPAINRLTRERDLARQTAANFGWYIGRAAIALSTDPKFAVLSREFEAVCEGNPFKNFGTAQAHIDYLNAEIERLRELIAEVAGLHDVCHDPDGDTCPNAEFDDEDHAPGCGVARHNDVLARARAALN